MPVPSDYNPNIPQPTDLLSVSQGNLLNNFGALQALIDVNHIDFAAAGAGKHSFVEMPVQNPVPTTSAGEVGLYSQTSAITAQPELVFARQMGSTAPAQVQVTEFTSARWQNPGWAMLPSGILLKWHSNIPFGGSQTVVVDLNTDVPTSPNYTNVLTVLVCGVDTAGTYDHVIAVKSNSGGGAVILTVYAGTVPPGTVSFRYLAIGY